MSKTLKALAKKVQDKALLSMDMFWFIQEFLKSGVVNHRVFFYTDELEGLSVPPGKAVEVEFKLISLSKLNNKPE